MDRCCPILQPRKEDIGLFTPDFTSHMEANLDLVETGLEDGPEVWSSFVTQFRDMHNNALSIRKQTATPRQQSLIESRMAHSGA